MPYALDAEVAELNTDKNRMVLELKYSGVDIERYFNDGGINLDLEALKGVEVIERETYSLSHISATFTKTDAALYRLECQLPDSVFVMENRGAIRIPYILGMQARVRVEVYLHALTVTGRLRNLSVSGCMIEIDLVESIALEGGQIIPGITLEFPNGETFNAEGKIRHIRPFGNNGYAAVGIQFINLSPPQSEALLRYVTESEREAAWRTGMSGIMVYQSPLFIAGQRERKILQREKQEREKRARQSPMEQGVMEVAHRLQVALMYMKTRNIFPQEIFYDCADTLLWLIKQDRKAFLYALSCVRDEAEWVRQAVQVAGKLADMLILRDPHDPLVREAVLGALMHTLGKPLLVSPELPSLKVNMNPAQKAILRGHVDALRQKLQALGWKAGPVCRDILENANELLDGSGYPGGKDDAHISPVVRLLSIIKTINRLTHGRNGAAPRTPLAACRKIHLADKAYDRTLLVEYLQVYGIYPIGSLAKYSGGFLGWIMDIDNKGMPDAVHIVKNLRFPQSNISSVVSKGDLAQLGKLEDIVDPRNYGLHVIKL
ncbi:PilZ domain-containing protein [Vagococcus sp. WN89Y]|uniref:PilZ domain-containing protein n=1 Tax=Vagococcus sp. WN89Y TaxID=3457258 RepID=UPI003FCDE96F